MREMGQSAWLSTSCPTLQGTEGRVNAREKGARCTEWISWGNNYSVWPIWFVSFIWLIWFIWLVSFNQKTRQTKQTK